MLAAMDGLLDGLRVLDLSRVLAGPFAGRVLAEMGADVIKVEFGDGDPARQIGPHVDGRSLYFSSLNSGKRGVWLDPAAPQGREQLETLLAGADVVVENFRPDAAAELDLRPAELLARHPQVVVVTVSGYARESSRADEGAYDVAVQAETGMMLLTGLAGEPPVRAGVPISDLAAGLWGALGAVSAVLARGRDGQGRHVEVPLFDAALPLLSYSATAALHTGEVPARVGSGHHEVVPYGAYAAKDGWVVIAALGDKFWPQLCAALELDALAGRADLREGAGRLAARAEVDAAVADAVAALSADEACARLRAAGVPHAPVRDLIEALQSPYVAERGLVQTITVPEGTYQVVEGPLRDGRARRPAPALGEHNKELL